VGIIVYQHRRGFITETDAVGQLEGEPAVRGGLTGSDADFFFHRFNDNLAALKITGQAFADSDDVSAQRPGGKERIKAGNTVDIIEGDTKGFSQLGQEFWRQIAKAGLRFLERYKQVFWGFIPGSDSLAHLTL